MSREIFLQALTLLSSWQKHALFCRIRLDILVLELPEQEVVLGAHVLLVLRRLRVQFV